MRVPNHNVHNMVKNIVQNVSNLDLHVFVKVSKQPLLKKVTLKIRCILSKSRV